MVEISQEKPVHLKEATHIVTDPGLMTLAAFLLAAGVWHLRLRKEQPDISPDDDLEPLGLVRWELADSPGTFDPRDPLFRDQGGSPSHAESGGHLYRLAQQIWQAFETRQSLELAKAVMLGMFSPDPLVRICALISAIEMFKFSPGELLPALGRIDLYADETTSVLAAILLSRLMQLAVGASSPPHAPVVSSVATPGLMLIHGTVLPQSQPVWSVPGVGPLAKYIAGQRTDLYSLADYFRWEGGYGDYQRGVASSHLDDWVQRRSLNNIDAVAHSHGGNVLMEATHRGTNFGKAVFLSCPVRWRQYQPRAGSIAKAQSVRIRFDFVILADRASQRFPAGTIPEHILPLYFVRHSVTTDPKTWTAQNLNRYL